MIILGVLIVSIWLIDFYTDWVTPHLDAVRHERGVLASMAEALGILKVVSI